MNNPQKTNHQQRIMVTGGAGFIGSHIVDAYISEGHEVIIIDNLLSGSMENINSHARFYEVDICSEQARKIIKEEQPEILNHHAAQINVRASVTNPINDININVSGLVGLIEAGKGSGLKKIIFASSGGAMYGEQEEFPATEGHPARPVNPYGINKLMCEKYLNYYYKQYGIPYVALRYANIYGPRQNAKGEAGVVAVFITRMLAGEQPVINGGGQQTRDYVYVDDVVSVNILALKDDMYGAYNVGTSIETDVNSVFNTLKELTGSKYDEVHGPAKQGEQQRSSISPSRLKKELGWNVTITLDGGLKRTVEWFKGGSTQCGWMLESAKK